MQMPKPPNTTRLTSQNHHHITVSTIENQVTQICRDQRKQESDVHAIQEHKLDHNKYVVRAAFTKATKQIHRKHRVEIGSSSLKTITTYKPGGTALIAQGDITGRIQTQESDPYGRWSYITFNGSPSKSIIIISAYQVCTKPTNQTGITAYHQQETAFNHERRNNSNPRYNFKHDLTKFIKHQQRRGTQVILLGDFNEHIDSHKAAIHHISNQCTLIDIWKRKHPSLDEPNTYLRGRTRIDYVLISPALETAVTAVGYQPFHHTAITDHRAIFIDFNTAHLFGNEHNELTSAAQRTLKTQRHEVKVTYIQHAAKHGHENNLFIRLAELTQSSTRDDALIERLDSILGQCCQVGEDRCKKVRLGDWSSKIEKLRIWRRALQKLISATTNNKVDALLPSIQTSLEEANINTLLPPDLITAKTLLTQARADIRKHVQNHQQTRLEELADRLAQERAAENTTKAKIIERILQDETRDSTFAMFRAIRNLNSKTGITRLQIPSPWPTQQDPTNGDWTDAKAWDKAKQPFREVNIPSELEYFLIQRNRRHFGQAEGTTFTKPPFSTSLNWQADTNAADLILEGDYNSTDLDDITALLLRHCERVTELDTIPPQITLADFVSKLKIWSESTSTSPSGRHLGHYKTLLKPLATEDLEYDEDQLNEDRGALLHAHLHIINYCLKHGYSMGRWKDILNIMILKEPGNTKIHRLRVIHLFEADYNLILSVKWRQQIKHAEERELLNEGQYGSRSGREAPTLPFLEELKNEISYCSRKPLLNLDNDASSCYDRIVVSLASLINRKYGQHRNVVLVNASTLQDARYRLKTEMGISEEAYSNCVEFPLHGTGQGSGNSPMIWCFISSTLFDCHQSASHGALFESPDRTVSVSFSIVGFVDDSTCNTNQFHLDTPLHPEQYIQLLQIDAQLWNDLLWISGGMLELPKCSYHFLYFDFHPDGTPYPRPGTVGPPLEVVSPSGHKIPIPSKSVFDPHKTLGHMKAPAGDGKTGLLHLITKQTRLSQQLSSSPATRRQATTFYHSIYLPSIYVLPQCYYSSKRLDDAEKKSMPSIFAKAGYNRNTSRALLYGPQDYGGGGFIRWQWLQGEGQIQNFLKHWRTDSQVSKVLRTAVSWYQHNTGVGFALFKTPSIPIEYSDARYLPSLRQFLSTIDGHLELDEAYIIPIQRQGDQHIMDLARHSNQYTESEMRSLNYCRLSLDVTTVADITTATGTYIIANLEWGEAIFPHRNRHHRAHQPPPAMLFWTYWQRFLRLISDRRGRLLQPLGNWLVPGSELRREWIAYYDSKYHKIFRRQQDDYYQYDVFDTRGINGTKTQWEPSNSSVPISIHETSHDCWELTSPPHSVIPTPTKRHHTSFKAYILSLPEWEREILTHVKLHTSPIHIMELLAQTQSSDSEHTEIQTTNEAPTTAKLTSDGSDKDKNMTFGWALSTGQGKRLATCSGPAHGKSTSHRAEATGMLSGSSFIYRLSQYSGLSPKRLDLFSDNKGLLTRLQARSQYSTNHPNATLAPDWDLVEQIHSTLKATKSQHPSFSHHIAHVKGHQDDHTPYAELSLEAQLNVDADAAAGAFHYHSKYQGSQAAPLLPTTKAQFHIGKQTITSHYRNAIRHAAAIQEFWLQSQRIHQWTPGIFALINQEHIRSSIRANCHQHKFIFKWIHHLLPTQEYKNQWEFCTKQCPRCTEDDDQHHFLRCPATPVAKWRTTLISSFRRWMESNQTNLVLITIFNDAVDAWLQHKTIQPHEYPPQYRSAIISQNLIGWDAFLRGYWSHQWAKLHQQHLTAAAQTEHHQSGQLWASHGINELWKQIRIAWNDHNDIIHGTTQKQEDHDLQSRTHLRIRHLHNQRRNVLAIHRDAYFIPNLDQKLATRPPINFLRNWLRLYEAAIYDSIAMANDIAIQHTRHLETYFPSTCSPTRTRPPRYQQHTHSRNDSIRKKTRNVKHPKAKNRITKYYQSCQ